MGALDLQPGHWLHEMHVHHASSIHVEILKDNNAGAQKHPHMATGLLALSSSTAVSAGPCRFRLLA